MVFKKIGMTMLSVVLAGALLAGCGSSTAPQTSEVAASSEAAESATAEVSSETTEEASSEATQETTEEASASNEAPSEATAAEAAATIDPEAIANDPSLQKIKDKGQLVVGTSADYPPYEFHALIDGKDQILGLDIQIADEIAKELGVECKIVDMSYDGLLMALQANQVDMVMAAMTPKPERKKSVDFSEIYFKATQKMLVRKDDADKYTTVESLKGKKIGVQKGSLQADIAKEQFPDSKAIALTKVPNLVMELVNNKVDAVLMESVVADGYLKKYPDLVISECPVEDPTGGSAIAIKKGNPALVAETNKIIEKLQAEGKIDEFMRTATEQSSGN